VNKLKTPEQIFILDNPDYEFFVVDTSLLEIQSGWSYREDAQDMIKELKSPQHPEHSKYYRVWSRVYTQRFFNK